MKNDEFKKMGKIFSDEMIKLQKKVKDTFNGNGAKIISNFNGQPFGRSRPSLNGKVFIVKNSLVNSNGLIEFWDGDYDHTYIPIDEVEFLESKDN